MSKVTQIFLSHSREEDGKFAHRLAADLRGKGLKVWIAPDSIRGGESWVAAIEHGLKASSHMVVILTPAATASRWVKKETDIAITMEIKGEIAVIPVDLKPCDVSAMLGSYQMVSFRGKYAAGLKALTKVLAVEETARPKRKSSIPFQWQPPEGLLAPGLFKLPEKPKPPTKSKPFQWQPPEGLLAPSLFKLPEKPKPPTKSKPFQWQPPEGLLAPSLFKLPEKPKPPTKSKPSEIKAGLLNPDWKKKQGIPTPKLTEFLKQTALDAPKLMIKTRSPLVRLEWSYAGLARNYVLEKGVTGTFEKPVEVYKGGETEYTHFSLPSRISGLALGNLYELASFYRVKAENFTGISSAWSNVIKVEDPKPQPAPVLKYDASGFPPKMTWTVVIGATGYELQKSDNALFMNPVKIYEGDSTEWLVGIMVGDMAAYYRVKANSPLNLFGSAWSNVVKVGLPSARWSDLKFPG